jgi:hypothetical protein
MLEHDPAPPGCSRVRNGRGIRPRRPPRDSPSLRTRHRTRAASPAESPFYGCNERCDQYKRVRIDPWPLRAPCYDRIWHGDPMGGEGRELRALGRRPGGHRTALIKIKWPGYVVATGELTARSRGTDAPAPRAAVPLTRHSATRRRGRWCRRGSGSPSLGRSRGSGGRSWWRVLPRPVQAGAGGG